MTESGGMQEGVPPLAVELRASHAIGGSKAPYYHATENGDACAGDFSSVCIHLRV